MEIWKVIESTNGDYSVSNEGRVRNNGYTVKNGNGFRRVKPSIRKICNHNQGYGIIKPYRDKGSFLVHRLVAEAFIPNPDNLGFVNHIDGNKKNNHVDNLEWCTRQENETHAYSTGLKNSTGSNNTMSKLTEKEVKEIKYHSKETTVKSLAYMYDVSLATIHRIQSNATWKHV